MSNKTINISVDEVTKAKAQAVFESLGLSFSTGVAIYLQQVVARQAIPFTLKAHPRPQRKTPLKKAGNGGSKKTKDLNEGTSLSDVISELQNRKKI